MNCASARRFLYAFADGELPVRDNCELLDHLKLCPDCTRLAAEQQALRAAVSRLVVKTPVPADLAQRVSQMVRNPAPVQRTRWLAWRMPLAAAATIALAAWGLSRQIALPPAVKSVPKVAPAIQVDPKSNAASLVVETHERCAAHFDTHHLKELPLDRLPLQTALNEHMANFKIKALAPDFGPGGFRLESANFCDIRQGRICGHILYVSDDGKNRISFFSSERWDCLERGGKSNSGTDSSRFLQFSVPAEGNKYSVVAWHDDQTTYICCGMMPNQKLLQLVEPVQTAVRANSARFASLLAEVNLLR